MWAKRVQQIWTLFHRERGEFIFEPVTHRLNPHPVLPQSMISAIAPAYEETLTKEREEKVAQEPQE